MKLFKNQMFRQPLLYVELRAGLGNDEQKGNSGKTELQGDKEDRNFIENRFVMLYDIQESYMGFSFKAGEM